MNASATWSTLQVARDARLDGKHEAFGRLIAQVDVEFACGTLKSVESLRKQAKDARDAQKLLYRLQYQVGYEELSFPPGGARLVADENCPRDRIYLIGDEIALNPMTMAKLVEQAKARSAQ